MGVFVSLARFCTMGVFVSLARLRSLGVLFSPARFFDAGVFRQTARLSCLGVLALVARFRYLGGLRSLARFRCLGVFVTLARLSYLGVLEYMARFIECMSGCPHSRQTDTWVVTRPRPARRNPCLPRCRTPYRHRTDPSDRCRHSQTLPLVCYVRGLASPPGTSGVP